MKISGIFLWICLPLFNVLNQVAMKLTARAVADDDFGFAWLMHAIATPYLWMSFSCEIINFVVWLSILKRHNVSEAFPLTAISYAALMLTSWVVFNEHIAAQQWMGICIIMLGIAMLGFGKKPEIMEGASDRDLSGTPDK